MDLVSLKGFFLWCWKDLLNFQFAFFNPLFWVIMLILFYFLRRSWEFKNAATFTLVSGLILLANTVVENRIGKAMASSGERFDPVIFRLFAVFMIVILFFAYSFLRESMKYGVFPKIKDARDKRDVHGHKHKI